MKIATINAAILVSVSTSAFAGVYSVNVKRLDSNLYRTSDGFIIVTKWCYEYTYGDDAILKYERYSYDNKLIFSSGTSCVVEKIFKG